MDTATLDSATRGMRLLTALFVVVLVLALFPFSPEPAGDIKYLITHWSIFFLALFWLLATWPRAGISHGVPLVTWILLTLLVVNLAAALASTHVGNSLNAWRRWAMLVLLYVLVARAFRSPDQAWRLVAVICVAVTVSSLYGFVQKAGLDPFPWAMREVEEYRGLPATYGNANFAGHTLAIAIILAVGLTTRRTTRWCALLAAAMLVHLYLSRMRATPVAMAAALLFVTVAFLVRRRTHAPLRAVTTTCLTVAALGIVAATAAAGIAKVKTGAAFPLDRSLLLRYQAYYGAAKMMLDRPLLGFGPGNYPIENPPYWTPYEQHWFAVEHRMNYHVHNDLLEAGVEAGVPGAAVYLGFLVSLVVIGLATAYAAEDKDLRRLGFTLSACFVMFAVDGLFGFNVRVPVSQTLLFVLAGLLVGATHVVGMPRESGWIARRLAAVALVLLTLGGAVLETRVFAAQCLYQRGRDARAQNHPDAAYDCFSRAGRFLVPWDWRFPFQMAVLDATSEEPARAAKALQRSLALNPNQVDALVWLGRAYLNQWSLLTSESSEPPRGGPLNERLLALAEGAGRDALALCPHYPAAHELLARIWYVRAAGQRHDGLDTLDAWKQVVNHARAALTYGYENRGRVQLFLAEGLAGTGRQDEAARTFARATKSDPADNDTWRVFAQFAEANGRFDSLLASLNANITRLEHEDTADTQLIVGLLLRAAQAYRNGQGDVARAEGALLHAIGLAPNRLDTWGELAALDPEGVENPLQRAVMRSVREEGGGTGPLPTPLETLSEVWESHGSALPDASHAIAKACQDRGADVDSDTLAREFGWLADLLATELTTANLQPEEAGAVWHNIGAMYGLMENWPAAEQALAQALPSLTGHRWLVCSVQRAGMLSQLGRFEEAVEFLEEVCRREPSDPAARMLLARNLARTGRIEQARAAYQTALRSDALRPEERDRLQQEYDSFTVTFPESVHEGNGT